MKIKSLWEADRRHDENRVFGKLLKGIKITVFGRLIKSMMKIESLWEANKRAAHFIIKA